MFKRLVLSCLLCMPTIASADANDGQFMGYTLGDNYPEATANSQVTTSGNLLIVATDAVKPTSIDEVTLVATSDYGGHRIDRDTWMRKQN